MGSVCELKLYLHPHLDIANIAEQITSEVRRLENKYTRYKPDSVTSKINASAGKGEFVEIDHETALILNYADALYQQSGGLFDITSGVLRTAWDFKSNQLPSQKSIQSILPLIGWQKVVRKNDSIHLPTKGMEIDFGGFVKEYTADVIATQCLDEGITHGLINLGGDVRIVGPHPDGSAWRIGIQHPREADKTIAVVEALQGGIATSGDYERYMMVDGKRYSHLLNPTTGESIQPEFASVSIIAETCLLAGSFSTIAMLKSSDEKNWLDELGIPYLTIDRSLRMSGSIAV